MSEAIFKKRAGRAGEVGLFATDEEGLELLFGIKDMRDVEVKITQRRNPRHHRLFFAILKFVKMHCADFEHCSTHEIKFCIKKATGYVEWFAHPITLKIEFREKSIAWGAMDQTEFSKFYQAAVDVICRQWMPPGTLPEDVDRELIEMVDGRHASKEARHA